MLDHPQSRKCVKIIACLQNDAFPACLTTHEVMTFWAAMVLPHAHGHDTCLQPGSASSAAPQQAVGAPPSELQTTGVCGGAARRVAVQEALAAMGLLGQQDTLVRMQGHCMFQM